MEDILLRIRDRIFKVQKDTLCEYSDYFRAMFSGNYKEKEQHEISIDVLDPNIMSIILQYIQIGLIDLSDFSLATIGELAIAANFLQITELIKQIEYTLDIQLSINNWMETMIIAENSSYVKLEQLSAAYGLLSFKNMKPNNIPSVHKLFWYLSHPYLNSNCELDVFRFGLQWLLHTETGADSFLLLLCCLDFNRLTKSDLKEMKILMQDYNDCLAAKVVDCLDELLSIGPLCPVAIAEKKNVLCERFTERVVTEVLYLTKESIKRKLTFTAAVPICSPKESKQDLTAHSLYTYSKGLKNWLEVAEKNLWGWNVVAWGPTRIVVVCGEHGRGTGIFMKDVKVYDTLRKEWIHHGVELPARRHGGVAIVDDDLYIVGGVGAFRIVLDNVLVYNLRQRAYRKIAKIPDTLQNPAVCTHENKVYAAGHKHIYRYQDNGTSDMWTSVLGTDIRVTCMVSYNGYIYCTQNYFNHLYRFKPDKDKELELVTDFKNAPAAMCNVGNSLLVFTRTKCGSSDIIAVEEFKGESSDEKPETLWSKTDFELEVNDVAGSCSLVLTIPPLNVDISSYHRRQLARYTDQL